MQGQEATNLTAQSIQEALRRTFVDLGFHVEASSRGTWAARERQRRVGLLGGCATTYCLTCIIDERHRTVRVWDAILQRRWGVLGRLRGTRAQTGVRETRAALAALIEPRGWKLIFGYGASPHTAPRLFSQ